MQREAYQWMLHTTVNSPEEITGYNDKITRLMCQRMVSCHPQPRETRSEAGGSAPTPC
jgi:hypothetical protein